ncbi:uncharacterized protein LOC144473394 [Augochlora pura]
MLRAPFTTCVWVLTILLSVATVNITSKDGYVSLKTNDSYRRRDRCPDDEQLLATNNRASSLKNVPQDWIQLPNKNHVSSQEIREHEKCLQNPLIDGSCTLAENVSTMSDDTFPEPRRVDHRRNPDNYHLENYLPNPLIEDSCNTAENVLITSNDTSPEPRRVDHRRNPVDYRWKRRTLCSLSDDGQYPYRRTLTSLNDPAFMDNVDDPDSLKTLVRVKRTGSSPNSPYEQEYYKDLADSFPRGSYQSVNENEDLSFDAKREANSREYYVKNQVEYNGKETDLNEPRSRELGDRVVSDEEKPSEQMAADSDAETVPKDLVFSAELVRRKRDDRGKESGLDTEKEIAASVEYGRPADEKKGAEKIEEQQQCPKASSLAIADLKADLLRIKRKARSERRAKGYKSKKKKKHAGKKRNESKAGEARGSRKIARSKHAQRPRSVRKGKNSDAAADGKSSHVRFSMLASKTNNQKNHFRRRSVSPAGPYGHVSGGTDRAPLRGAADRRAAIRVAETNGDGNTAEHDSGDGADKRYDDEAANGLMERDEPETRNGYPKAVDAKVRAKREKTADAKHGFLSDEDELRYYQNIREFEPVKDCGVVQDDDGSPDYETGLGRAVRSIEEVKDLAKKLVTKVDELENYLSVDEAKRNENDERKLEIRAIDDLCSNVTATCADFKATSAIVPRCVPTSTPKITTDKKIRKKEAYNRARQKKGNFATKKRSSRESNGKTLSKPLRNSRRDIDKSQKWGRWTDWSSCSVTCGKGRQIRWRYCLHDCTVAETEMEEKACQLPACPPGKFLGIF